MSAIEYLIETFICADRTAVFAADFLKGQCSFGEFRAVKHEEGDKC